MSEHWGSCDDIGCKENQSTVSSAPTGWWEMCYTERCHSKTTCHVTHLKTAIQSMSKNGFKYWSALIPFPKVNSAIILRAQDFKNVYSSMLKLIATSELTASCCMRGSHIVSKKCVCNELSFTHYLLKCQDVVWILPFSKLGTALVQCSWSQISAYLDTIKIVSIVLTVYR